MVSKSINIRSKRVPNKKRKNGEIRQTYHKCKEL